MAIGNSPQGYYTPSGQWVDPMQSVFGGISSGMQNPLYGGGNMGMVNPNTMYATNANVYNNQQSNQAGLMSQAMQSSAQLQAALANAQSNLMGTQYGANTQFNIADLQNAGLNWRTSEQLKNALDLAGINTQSAERIVGQQTGAQRYGADQQLAAANAQAGANRYGSLANLLGTLGSSRTQADASKYNANAGLLGQYAGYDTSRANTGLQTLGGLLQTKMQQQAQIAPTQLSAEKFKQSFPVLLQLLKKRGYL